MLRDKGDGARQKSKPAGPELPQSNRPRYPDEGIYSKKQVSSGDYRKGSAGGQYTNVEPIKIQIQRTLEELRQDQLDHALMLSKAHNSLQEQRLSQTEPKAEVATPAHKSQSSPLKGSNLLSEASEDEERRSAVSEKSQREQHHSQPDKNDQAKADAGNQDDGQLKEKLKIEPALNDTDGDKEIKEEGGSPAKMSTSPEKQSPGLRK